MMKFHGEVFGVQINRESAGQYKPIQPEADRVLSYLRLRSLHFVLDCVVPASSWSGAALSHCDPPEATISTNQTPSVLVYCTDDLGRPSLSGSDARIAAAAKVLRLYHVANGIQHFCSADADPLTSHGMERYSLSVRNPERISVREPIPPRPRTIRL